MPTVAELPQRWQLQRARSIAEERERLICVCEGWRKRLGRQREGSRFPRAGRIVSSSNSSVVVEKGTA